MPLNQFDSNIGIALKTVLSGCEFTVTLEYPAQAIDSHITITKEQVEWKLRPQIPA